jgi:hypothetical protein
VSTAGGLNAPRPPATPAAPALPPSLSADALPGWLAAGPRKRPSVLFADWLADTF